MGRTYTFDDENEPIGSCFLIYSRTGVGKTRSAETCPSPIKMYVAEPRDPRITLDSQKARSKKWIFVEFETFDEYIEDLNSTYEEYNKGKRPFETVFFDGASFLQGKFKTTFEDDRFDSELLDKDKDSLKAKGKLAEDSLINRFRIERNDWGGLGSVMKRLTWLLNKISKFGVVVIMTATEDEYPKYERDLKFAPQFLGKDFPSSIHGYFDFIGRVESRFDKNGDKIFPPSIDFNEGGDAMAKLCGDRLREKVKGGKAPLDFEKILKVIKGVEISKNK
jgi:hypothetical protein